MTKVYLIIFVLLGTVIFNAYYAFGDTVYFDGNKVEGIIVEETSSTVTIETTIGKVSIQKNKIKKIERLAPEENYLTRGDYYHKQQRYDEAIIYYQKALEAKPGYAKAQEVLNKAQEAKKELELRQQAEVERQEEYRKEKKETLEKDIGLVIDVVNGEFIVIQVNPGSSSAHANIKADDRIVSIDNTDVTGMTLENVCEKLLAKKPISLSVEREVRVPMENIEHKQRTFLGIGIFLGSYGDSLYISSVMRGKPAARAGLEVGDILTKINNQPTENLSPDEAAKLITGEEGVEVSIFILKSPQIK